MRRCSVHYCIALLCALQQGWWAPVYGLERSPLVHCIGEPSSSSLNNLHNGEATASKSAGPAVLKIEPSSDSVHIKKFTSQMQPGADPTLHRGEIHFPEINSTGGDELFAEGSATLDAKRALVQLFHQVALHTQRAVRPAQLRFCASDAEHR